jgi:diguanylate cyclase (GGDEF)-like protein/PAS domain S-box-containing protein
VRFLLLAPVICLTSASFSVSGLWALGYIDAVNFAENWAAWWVGDTLGLVVMLPLSMIVAGEPRALWESRMRTVAAPILLSFAIFILIFLKVNQWEYNDSLTEFRQFSQQTVNQVQNEFEEQESMLEQTAALFMHDMHGRVSREEFHRFVEKSLTRFPMIQALEWASPVDAAHRAGFEAAQRKDVPGFEIRERDTEGLMRRAGERSSFYPLTYVEPLAGNEPALGFDLASNAKRQSALTEAIQCGTVVTSPALRLVQEHQQQAGVLLLLAVNPHDKESGVVLSVLRMGDLMDPLLRDTRPMLYTRLVDLDEQKTIYDNFVQENQHALYEHAFDFGTRHYRLETAPTPAYFKQHHGWQSWGVLAVGILGTGLLGALLLLGTGYTARIEAQVEDRTRKLKESESRFRNTLENAPIGMGITAPDGRFMQVNRALCAMLGYEKEELEKLTSRSITHPEDMASSLANVQLLLDGKINSFQSQKRYLRKDGQVVWAQLSASIERDDSGAPLYFIGQIEDITERKQLEQQLSRRLRHRDIMERITQISLNSANIEDLLGRVLDEMLAIFNADRTWFLYPCDPDALSWSVPMERTRPEWPGAFARGKEIPMTPDVAEVFRELLTFAAPLPYGPAASRGIPAAVAEQFSIRSQIQMALRPKLGSPWVMGLHHCAQARAYDEDELLIFKDIGQRVADALSSMIMLKNLRESEGNLHRAQAVGQVGSWLLNISANRLEWSAETYRMFGIPQYEAIGLETLVAVTHPDDRDFVLKAWDEAMAGAPYDIEHRIVAGGQVRWVRERARIERDSEGRPLTGIGTVQDITERKQAEHALRRESEKNLALLHNASDGIHILDLDGNTIEVSDSFCTMLGYQRNEMIGMNVSKWDAMFESTELSKIISQQYEQGTRIQFESRHLRKDGTLFDVEISGFPLELDGKPVMFYSSRDITERKTAEEQIHNLAFYDALTQLPNRRLLNDRLGQTLAASRRSGCYGALMFLDLDNFKPLNDKHGHAVGDLLLIEVAHRLGCCVRETDTVARFGGDEFVVMLSDLDKDKAESVAQAGNVAEKIRVTLAEPYALTIQPDGEAKTTVEHHCTSSIGVVVFNNYEASQEDILKWADMAMYQAKEAGRNQIQFYDVS